MTKEKTEAICDVCGQPYGNCDLDVHNKKIKKIDSAYGFGNETVETPYHKGSISPKASQPRTNAEGVEVADVNAVTYDEKK